MGHAGRDPLSENGSSALSILLGFFENKCRLVDLAAIAAFS